MTLKDFAWGTPTRRAVAISTAVFGVVSGFGSAIKAYSEDIEPLMPAQRYYVQQRVAEYKPVINQLLRWQAEDQKSKLDAERAQWGITLQQPTTNDQTRAMIQNRVRQIDSEKEQIEHRLQTIMGR